MPHATQYRWKLALYWPPKTILTLCYPITSNVHDGVFYWCSICDTLCHHLCKKYLPKHWHLCVYMLCACATPFLVGWGVWTCNHWHTMWFAMCLVQCTWGINYFMPDFLCLWYVIAPFKCTYHLAHMHSIFQHCNVWFICAIHNPSTNACNLLL